MAAGLTENKTGYMTLQASTDALGAHVRVKLSGGKLVAAGASDDAIGVTTEPIPANSYGTVKLWSASGDFLVQAAGAVTAGAQVYAAASGAVDDSGTKLLNYIALDAASTAGEVIRIIPIG